MGPIMSITESPKRIPVIINNRNRLTSLRALITWLEKMGMERIYVLDNDSDYPPLLEYYREFKHTVVYLSKNFGYMAFWESEIYQNFQDDYFIYTDSDVLPVDECPADFLDIFLTALAQYPQIDKVGFGLKIDDLPDHYRSKQRVLAHEAQFWKKPIAKYLFDADVDTTFALYRPLARGGWWAKAFRTGQPYIARHLPWYIDSSNIPAEEKYYLETSTTDSTWAKQQCCDA
jgi:hypothetical protein